MVGVGLYCEKFLWDPFVFQESTKPFINLSLSKAGTFTKKNAWTPQNAKFPKDIDALLNPY